MGRDLLSGILKITILGTGLRRMALSVGSHSDDRYDTLRDTICASKYMELLAKNIFLVDIKIVQSSPQNHNCLANTLTN